MKITRRELRRIIAEAIKLPKLSGDVLFDEEAMDTVPAGLEPFVQSKRAKFDPAQATDMDTQQDYLSSMHGTTAKAQLDTQFNPDMIGGTNAMHNKTQGLAKAMSPSVARSKSDEIYRQAGMSDNNRFPLKAAVTKLKSMLEPEYLLVDPDTDMDLFNRHVQRRQPDPSGKRIMVVMADNSREVVYKDAFPRKASGSEGVNYYHFLIPSGMVGR